MCPDYQDQSHGEHGEDEKNHALKHSIFCARPVRDQIYGTKRAFAQLFLHLAKQQDRVLWVDILGPVLGKVPPDDILIQQLEMANPLQHEDTKKVVNSLNPSEMF